MVDVYAVDYLLDLPEAPRARRPTGCLALTLSAPNSRSAPRQAADVHAKIKSASIGIVLTTDVSGPRPPTNPQEAPAVDRLAGEKVETDIQAARSSPPSATSIKRERRTKDRRSRNWSTAPPPTTMSNKRLKRTEPEFFVYKPGVVVPRDVTHLLVPPGVEVLPAGVFQGRERLKEIVLPEGLREIGPRALEACQSLKHIDFPATLVRIGDYAFHFCPSLATLRFQDGLVEIGRGAFNVCIRLNHISLPPTVVAIGGDAFCGCSSLEVLILVDGIRTIGGRAFQGCPLEEIVLPATVTSIGGSAFGWCHSSLKAVKLSGGIQLIRAHTFLASHLLDRVMVTPKSLVVTITEDENDLDFEFATDGKIVPHSRVDRVVIASECFHSTRVAELSTLKFGMAEILEMGLPWDNTRERLRELLAPHERRRKEEVTTILELGLWKAEMRRSGGMAPGTRTECRLTCKAGTIIPNVVPFL